MKYRVSLNVDGDRIAAVLAAAFDGAELDDPNIKIEVLGAPDAAPDEIRRSPWSKRPQEPKKPRAEQIAAAAAQIKTPVKRGRVKFGQAVERLRAPFPQVAEKLAAWKNKAGGLHGWDRMLKTQFPNAAAELWD
jgi:hypothetical protein